MPIIHLEDTNIVDVQADIIVNSLGVGKGTVVYGGICKSIIQKAKSKELENMINNARDVYVLGDFFLSNNYGLNCKKILNLVTPYKEKDEDLSLLKDCIRRIISISASSYHRNSDTFIFLFMRIH